MKVWGTFFKSTKEGLKTEDFDLDLEKREFLGEFKKDATKILREEYKKSFRGIQTIFIDETEKLETTKKTQEKKEEKEKIELKKEIIEELKKEILEEVLKEINKKFKKEIKKEEIVNEIKDEILEKVKKQNEKNIDDFKKEFKKEKIKEDKKNGEEKKGKVASGLKKAKALLNIK